MFYQHQHLGVPEYFCKEYGKNFNFPIHLHSSFEFITVLSGEMQIAIDNTSYTLHKGESALVLPHQLHSLSSENSTHMLCIFSPELVKAYASKVSNKKPMCNGFSVNKYLVDALDALSENASTLEKKGVLYSICAEFDKHISYTKSFSGDELLLKKIFAFVEENYADNCELLALAQTLGYSYSYLSRCFKKTTGISFNSYVNRYRVSNACYLLNNYNYSILRCALESGYTSVRSFNRNFKTILGISPTEYQEKMQSAPSQNMIRGYAE